MIKDGAITYPGVRSTLQTWQPVDPVIYAILVATLTTILSYQATSLLFDLALGFKPRGNARVSDVGTLLLTEEASLPAACANLWDNSFIARWKFHGFRGHCPRSDLHLENNHMRLGVFAKFLSLLVVAPLVNLLTIVLNIENDRFVSFEEAQFGGISFGVNDNLTAVLKAKHSEMCSHYEPRYARLETPLTEFLTCTSEIFVGQAGVDAEPVSTFKLSRGEVGEGTPGESIVAEFTHGKLSSRLVHHADVYVSPRGKAYRLRPALTLEQGTRLFQVGIERQLKECGDDAFGSMETRILSAEADVQHQKWEISQEVRCVRYAESQSMAVMVEMTGPMTLVNDEKFEVLELKDPLSGEVENPTFESGDTFPLLKRRRTIASFLTLSIAVLCVAFLRGLTKFLTNNDIYIGIELVLKDKFGLSCCDSMLQSTRKVQYRATTEVKLDSRSNMIQQKMSEWAQSEHQSTKP